ncbi:MAG: hypothetical protein H6582_10165 [Crocinitomicaceae bacterium]|nr:hypothetical protein [Crocinitomicaceae bacterium]
MKYSFYLIPLTLLFSCSGNTEESSNHSSNDDNDAIEDIVDELFDDDTKVGEEFKVFEGVERYDNDNQLGFDSYDFQGVFEFTFPVEPEFEEELIFDKYGYDKYSASKVYEGTIYKVVVEDYSKNESKVIDDMEVYIGHSSNWEYIGGVLKNSVDVVLPNGLKAKYATYTWDLDDKTYCEDLITVGLKHHIVYFFVTSRPNFETAQKINEFISGFKVL